MGSSARFYFALLPLSRVGEFSHHPADRSFCLRVCWVLAPSAAVCKTFISRSSLPIKCRDYNLKHLGDFLSQHFFYILLRTKVSIVLCKETLESNLFKLILTNKLLLYSLRLSCCTFGGMIRGSTTNSQNWLTRRFTPHAFSASIVGMQITPIH